MVHTHLGKLKVDKLLNFVFGVLSFTESKHFFVNRIIWWINLELHMWVNI